MLPEYEVKYTQNILESFVLYIYKNESFFG